MHDQSIPFKQGHRRCVLTPELESSSLHRLTRGLLTRQRQWCFRKRCSSLRPVERRNIARLRLTAEASSTRRSSIRADSAGLDLFWQDQILHAAGMQTCSKIVDQSTLGCTTLEYTTRTYMCIVQAYLRRCLVSENSSGEQNTYCAEILSLRLSISENVSILDFCIVISVIFEVL